MPYSIDRYRSNAFLGQPGWPLELNDSNINSSQTSLRLIGRGVPNYGEFIIENFVHILENFAGEQPPDNPITGQLWFDANPSSAVAAGGIPGTLKVFNGFEFMPVTSATSGSTFPASKSIGQIHFQDSRAYIFDGLNWKPFVQYTQGGSDPTTAQVGDLFYNATEDAVKIRINNPTPQWRSLVSVNGDDSIQSNNFGMAAGFYLHKSINPNVTALGSSQSLAQVLSNNINIVTSAVAGSNTGVRFDVTNNVPVGTEITVVNPTNVDINVYPHSGGMIDNLATNAAFAIGAGGSATFVKATASRYYSLRSIYS